MTQSSRSPRHRPHRRFRQPGHPAHRAARARGRRLLRDRALQQCAEAALRRAQAQGHHPLRRPGLGAPRRQPARAAGRLRARRAGARHLLWRADHVRPARRQGRRRPPPRIRPRRCSRSQDDMRAVRRRLGKRRAPSGLDEPWRPRHRPARRASRSSATSRQRALRRRSPTKRGASTACSSIPKSCTRPTAPSCCRISSSSIAGHPAATGRWRAFRARGGRRDPRRRSARARHLRPLGRRRFRRRRGADPRGDRRPAHLHLRRSRPDAARRGERGRRLFRDHYNIPLVHVDALGRCSSARSTASSRPGEEAQDHRPAVHRRVRGGGQEARRRRLPRAGHALSRRDRKRLVHRRPVGHDQVAPQCRRPARAHEHEARRAAARTVQGRGARARPRARPAREPSSAATRFPGPGLAIRSRRASRAKSSTSCARPTPSISTRSARPASTTRSGRPSPCCCRCRPSA